MWESKEKCNKWHFDESGKKMKGWNNTLIEKFKAFPYYSLIRESIQNSLDAVNDPATPVIVKYEFTEINRSEYPELIEGVIKHIEWCAEHYNKETPKFLSMIKEVNGEDSKEKRPRISVLRISDYNTVGMEYRKDDYTATFNAFLRYEGNSIKNDSGSGGSFGFGKGAYYNLSAIRTLVVSTKNTEDEYVFEGATMLATHKNPETGKLLDSDGFYNCTGEPVTNPENIPEFFKRNEIGTDINIIGLKYFAPNRVETLNEMIKAVLNNFWLAILKNKLIVKFSTTQMHDEYIINSENLEDLIEEYFPDEKEGDELTDGNPKPYFRAVKYAGTNDKLYYHFEKELPTEDKMEFYVYKKKGLPDRIAYFRKPLMLVKKKRKRRIKGYVGVFIYKDPEGNKILKAIENPQHDDWIPDRLDDPQQKKQAKKLIKEINEFIKESLDKISGLNDKEEMSVPGLTEILAIPAELIEEDINTDSGGKNTGALIGESTGIISDRETGVMTTRSEAVIRPEIEIPKPTGIEEEEIIENENVSETEIFQGGENTSDSDGNLPGFKDADSVNIANVKKEENGIVSYLPVKLGIRVVALAGGEYKLIIRSDKEHKKVKLSFYAGTDNGEAEKINIEHSDKRTFSENELIVPVQKEKNVFKIKFKGNIRYSLKFKSYAIR